MAHSSPRLRVSPLARFVLFLCLPLLAPHDARALATSAPGAAQDAPEIGRAGGGLVVALRAEPRTLNPVTALDAPSREIIRRLHGDLVRINRATLQPEPELAEAFDVSRDGRRLTVTLRRGLRFSDGTPCTADDVVFSFEAHLDEKTGSPQRDLLVVGGTPMSVRKLDERRVSFSFAAPYAPAARLFDGVAILPRHVLGDARRAGTLGEAWALSATPASVVGLGPFRLREVVPGQRVVLERNPHYWKRDAHGGRLPYLDRLTFLVVPNEDAQVLRLKAGELDLIGRLSPASASALGDGGQAWRLIDAGPSLEYNFLLPNLNPPPAGAPDAARALRAWWMDVRVRRAISLAVDRAAIARLVYHGRGTPLAVPVSPANRPWFNDALRPPARDVAAARALLASAGGTWRDRQLLDASGRPVAFSIAVAASNVPRRQMATMIAADLGALGVTASVAPLEFRALVDRVTRSLDFDFAVMGLASGDVDPAADLNVWRSAGATHLWRLDRSQPPLPWEREIDALMDAQLTERDAARRKQLFDRVQAIAAAELPVIPLASPHLLVAVRGGLANVHASVLDSSALWNADEIFWRNGPPASRP